MFIRGDQKSEPVLFGHGTMMPLQHGRGTILRAIASGLLKRERADLESWMRIIEGRIPRERHPGVLAEMLHKMRALFGVDAVRTTQLFDQAIQTCPAVLERDYTVLALADHLQRFTPQETLRAWLRTMKDYALYSVRLNDAWAVEQVRQHLADQNDIPVVRGLAYAAAKLWNQEGGKALGTEVLVALAGSPDEAVQKAVANVFVFAGELEGDEYTRRLVSAVSDAPAVLRIAAPELIEAVAPLTAVEPQLALGVCRKILDTTGPQLNDLASPLAAVAETLTNIALTLHRQPTHKRIWKSFLSIFRGSRGGVKTARVPPGGVGAVPVNSVPGQLLAPLRTPGSGRG